MAYFKSRTIYSSVQVLQRVSRIMAREHTSNIHTGNYDSPRRGPFSGISSSFSKFFPHMSWLRAHNRRRLGDRVAHRTAIQHILGRANIRLTNSVRVLSFILRLRQARQFPPSLSFIFYSYTTALSPRTSSLIRTLASPPVLAPLAR